jgi:D-lactate dehydrogenase (cytochrome)
MAATNRWSRSSYPETDTLFFEFQGSPAAVEEQIASARALAADNGGGAFRWAETAEGRSQLWKARHEALYAALALKPGAKAWTTDVCVPVSSLESCVLETRRDIDSSPLTATMVGHVGDGNFHVVFLLDPDRPEDLVEAKRLNARLIERALLLDGTCTGEHGIGIGKMEFLEPELGEAVDVMRAVKAALDPDNIMNPGKIFHPSPVSTVLPS